MRKHLTMPNGSLEANKPLCVRCQRPISRDGSEGTLPGVATLINDEPTPVQICIPCLLGADRPPPPIHPDAQPDVPITLFLAVIGLVLLIAIVAAHCGSH